MRGPFLAIFLAAQLAAPALAADLDDERTILSQRPGAFAGARLRLSLGGGEARERVRAGLVMAPTLRTESTGHRTALRFGDGVELGLRANRPPTVSIAGRPLLGDRDRAVEGRAGVSTLGWVAIGVGGLALLLVAATVTCQETNCLGSE